MDFKDIIGQKNVIGRLRNSIIDDRVGHAYIFAGQKGIGKKTVAEAFSHMLLCSTPTRHGSCNVCTPCRLWNENSNPDFYQIQTSEDNILIEDIRNMQNNIVVKPLYSHKKVYLIIDAEKMTVQAQNCLLKILEEPPQYAVIILTTSNYEALLSTIRSRGVKYNFSKYSQDEIKEIINLRFNKHNESLDFIAHYSDGIIGTALNLAESPDFIDLRENTFDIIHKLSGMKDIEYFDIYGFFEDNKENIDIILDVMSIFYRDIIVTKSGGKENMLINSDKKNKIISEARNYSIDELAKRIELIELTRSSLKQNINYQLCIEKMIIGLWNK